MYMRAAAGSNEPAFLQCFDISEVETRRHSWDIHRRVIVSDQGTGLISGAQHKIGWSVCSGSVRAEGVGLVDRVPFIGYQP